MVSTIDQPIVQDNFVIPLIDFGAYLHGSPEEQQKCIDSIMEGFTTSGFLYLQNSGLNPQEAFSWSAKYFDLPLEAKQRYRNDNPKANRGYSGMGVEKVTNADLENPETLADLRALFPDIKESLEIGSEHAYGNYPVKEFDNHWPDADLPGFHEGMMDFYVKCDNLHKQLMSAIARGLKLPSTYFSQQIGAGDHVLRLLHYPAVSSKLLTQEGAVRAGAHTDYGTITLLFQDNSGGLQVRTPDGQYRDVPPIEDAIVINAADLLQIWTNDKIKSTFHRVVSPPHAPTTEDGHFSARYSIAFFAHPDHETIIDTVKTCWHATQVPKKYEPIKPIDWMLKRLQATY